MVFLWYVDFSPGETKTIRHTFKQQVSQQYSASWCYPEEFHYIIETGAFWQDDIGRAEFRVNFNQDAELVKINPTRGHTAVPGDDPTRVQGLRWLFTNWKPKPQDNLFATFRDQHDLNKNECQPK